MVLNPLSHPSCLAASIVSFLGLSQARLFPLVWGRNTQIWLCGKGVLGVPEPCFKSREWRLTHALPQIGRDRGPAFSLGHIAAGSSSLFRVEGRELVSSVLPVSTKYC